MFLILLSTNFFIFVDFIQEKYRMKVIKLQETAALSINLMTVFIIYILVSHTKMGYMDNILDNNAFFSYFIFLISQGNSKLFIDQTEKTEIFLGVIIFLFIILDFNIHRKLGLEIENTSKLNISVKLFLKFLVTLLVISSVAVPPLLGCVVHNLYKHQEYFVVFAKETNSSGSPADVGLMVNLILLSQVNTIQPHISKHWTQVGKFFISIFFLKLLPGLKS